MSELLRGSSLAASSAGAVSQADSITARLDGILRILEEGLQVASQIEVLLAGPGSEKISPGPPPPPPPMGVANLTNEVRNRVSLLRDRLVALAQALG